MVDEEPNEAVMPEEDTTTETQPVDSATSEDKRVADLTNDLKRLQAEFENFKKRTEKEWVERSKVATQRLVTDLLGVLDSFDKALEDTEEDCNRNSHKAGLQRLQKQLLQTLQREGLKEIKAEGKFDPFVHEALTSEEREDVEDGQILEVYQKGYALGQKTLRPARVKVAKRKAQELENEESHDDDQPISQTSEKEEDENQ
jgi:molecular chaperone GrpE